MKINKLNLCFLSIFGFISIGISANDSKSLTKQEKELQNILNIIEQDISQKPEDKKTINKSVQTKPVIEDKKTVETIVLNEKEYTVESIEQTEENSPIQLSRFKEVKSENIEFDYQSNIELASNYDHVYLLNIPIKTRIYANEDLYIYPFRDGVIYKSGSKISASPLNENEKTTFCYIKVKESGQIRRFRASTENYMTIESNYSTKQTYKDNENNTLELYQTTFNVDNPHIDGIRCLTTEKTLPLTIGDLNREFGSLFKFEFPEVIDI